VTSIIVSVVIADSLLFLLLLIPSGVARICCGEGNGWRLRYGTLTAGFMGRVQQTA